MAQTTTNSPSCNTGIKRLTRTIKSSLRHQANFSSNSAQTSSLSLNNNQNPATNSNNTKSPKLSSQSTGYSNKARAFLSRGAQAIVRMRGLPFSCNAQQVVEFFAGKCEILDGEDGILFVKNYDEKPTGDAFVLFASDEQAQRALQKHRQNIGSRYVELFRSSISEVQQVLSISMDSSPSTSANSATTNSNSTTTSSSSQRQRQHQLSGSTKPSSPQPAVRAQTRAAGATYAQVATTSSRAAEETAAPDEMALEPKPRANIEVGASDEQAKREGSDSSAFDSNSLNSSGSSSTEHQLAPHHADNQAALSPSSAARSPISTLSAGSTGSSSGHRSWQTQRGQRNPSANHSYRAAQHHHYQHHAHPQAHYGGGTHYGPPPAAPFHYANQHHQRQHSHQHHQQHQHYQPLHLAYPQQQPAYHSPTAAAGQQMPAHLAYAPHPYHFYPQAMPAHPQAYSHEAAAVAASKRDCVRLRGLPFEAQVEDVLYFLGDHSKSIVYQGVHMVYSAQGQPSGEAIIQMISCAAASIAAQEFHRKVMSVGKKQRYIEVIPCSIDDMNLMLGMGYLGRSLLPAPHNTPLHQQLAATAYPPPAYPHHLHQPPAQDQKAQQRPSAATDATPSPVEAPATATNAVSPDSPQEKPESASSNHKLMSVPSANIMQPQATYYPILYYYPQQMLAAPYH